MRFRSLLLAFVLASCANSALGQVQNRDLILFEIASTWKDRADEAFLTQQLNRAKDFYRKAEEQLYLVTVLPEHISGAHDALGKDIRYRQLLLKEGLDFWGGVSTLSPSNPVVRLSRLEEALNKLNKVVEEIDQYRLQKSTTMVNRSQISALKAAARTDATVQTLSQAKEEVVQAHHRGIAASLQDRIDSINARQKEIANEREKLVRQIADSQRQLSGMLIQGVSSALGIPSELTALADTNKNLEERLMNAGRALLAGNSEFGRAFEGISEHTAKIADAYRRADSFIRDVKKAERIVRETGNALRQGTIEGALAAGKIVYEALPPEERKKISSPLIDKIKPLSAVIAVAAKVPEIREAVSQYVSTLKGYDALLADMFNLKLESAPPEFRDWVHKVLAELCTLQNTPDQERILLRVSLRLFSEVLVETLSVPEINALLKATGAKDAPELVEFLRIKGLDPTSALKIEQLVVVTGTGANTIRIDVKKAFARSTEGRSHFDFSTWRDQAQAASIELTKLAKAGNWRLLTRLSDLPGQSLLNLVPTSHYNDALAGKLGRDFDRLFGSFSSSTKTKTADALASLQVGNLVGIDNAPRAPVGAITHILTGATSANADQKKVEALAKAALSAAVPAAAVAFMVADAAAALQNMSNLIAEINDLTNEDKGLMVEKLNLYNLIRDARFNQAVSEFETSIAVARERGAVLQVGHFQQSLDLLADQITDVRAKEILRLPIAFLLAETVRMHYDLLDKSLAFWKGSPAAERGWITSRVQSDPQMRRYGLDPDISLYKWLDRSGESDRGNLDGLVQYWRKKVEIIRALCDAAGCLSDNAFMGPVKLSSEIKLKNHISSKDWSRFRRWQQSPDGPFALSFFVDRDMLGLDERLTMVRIVDVRLGGSVGASIRSVNQASLLHPGVAYANYRDGYRIESYLRRTKSDLFWAPALNPEDLAARWGPGRNLSLRSFEGYSPITQWQLTLSPDALNRQLEDIVLMFALQYQEPDAVMSDRDLEEKRMMTGEWQLTFKTPDQLPLSIPLSRMPYLNSPAEASSRLSLIRTQSRDLNEVAIARAKR